MASARSASLDDSDEEMASKAADEGNASGRFGSADVGWAGMEVEAGNAEGTEEVICTVLQRHGGRGKSGKRNAGRKLLEGRG